MTSKGGPRRRKVEESCPEHLFDSLSKWMEVHENVDFGEYANISKTQGMSVPDVVRLAGLIDLLFEVNSTLEFRYLVLKDVAQRLINKFPALKANVPVSKQGRYPGDLANMIMTLCTHCRRLKKPECLEILLRNCTKWQGQVLERLSQMLCSVEEGTNLNRSDSSVTPALGDGQPDDEMPNTQDILALDTEGAPDTPDILALQIPRSQESEEMEGTAEALLNEALSVKPVPARKQNLRDLVDKVNDKGKVLKRPAAGQVLKRPSAGGLKRHAGSCTRGDNYIFDSLEHGKCRAEFYTYKSYIRRYVEATNSWTLVIQVEGPGHEAKLEQLVPHAKKLGSTKETLREIRASL